MKTIMYAIIILLTLSFGAGCHNDSPFIPDVTDPDPADIRTMKAAALMGFFCKAELDKDGEITYTPDWGTVLYSTTPMVRYVEAYDLEDAYRWFTYLVNVAELDMQQNITEYKIEGHGSIRFNPSTTSDRVATIHVDLVAMPEVKEFVFITKDRWPHNDRSPFNYGAVYKENSTGNRYVCIAESRSGIGMMITFDNNTGENWKMEHLSRNRLWINDLPVEHELEIIRKFLYNNINGTYVEDFTAKEIFEKPGMGLAPNIYSDPRFIRSLLNLEHSHYVYSFSSDHSSLYFKELNVWTWTIRPPDWSVYTFVKIYKFDSYINPDKFTLIRQP